HHDDIMLGMMPHIIHLIREPSNQHIFTNMTSGFTSVTNQFLKRIVKNTLKFLEQGKIQMTDYSDFFTSGHLLKWDKDVYHYLDKIASNDSRGQSRGLSHRVVRSIVSVYEVTNKEELKTKLQDVLDEIGSYYDGQKNSKDIQKLKGMIREYEEELVWANYGVRVKDVHHLRLGFYQGDIFTEEPQNERDVTPVLEQLREFKPTVISLAMDPEGSGPDTHYKVLQTIAHAVRLWSQEVDPSNLRIWGYRNVWYRFDLAEADIIVPVTLNSMSILNSTFMNCYLSQKDASFPSYEYDGPFCELSQKIWVEQHHDLQLLLGRDYWYRNENPHLRAVHGAVYLKEMDVDTFLGVAREIENSTEVSGILNDY
ncbi:MAG: glucosamine-6-phosphate isomerase, partial [Candidatus Neomarinimicrobiota bacterium]